MIDTTIRGAARGWRALAATLLLAALGACGGGGGSGSSASFTLSTYQMDVFTDRLDVVMPYQDIVATVTGLGSGRFYLRVDVQGDAATVDTVTVTSATTGQFRVTPVTPRSLGPGRHTTALMVHVCTSDPECTSGDLPGSPQRVDVTYTINGVATDLAGLDFAIGNTVAPADLVRTAAIQNWPDANYAMSADVDWLTVHQQAGATAGASTLEADLDAAHVDALDDGTYTGHVTLTPQDGDPQVIPVTLQVARTESRHVAPWAEVSGVAQEVIIRGDHFDLMHVNGVTFGAQAATAFRVVSPTEIRATHPALPAGHYPVTLQTTEGGTRDRAALTVYDASALAPSAATIAYPPDAVPWGVTDVVVDAARQAVFVLLFEKGGADHVYLVRYAYGLAGWHLTGQVGADGGRRMALSTDGDMLLVAGDSPAMRHFDAQTLALLATNTTGSSGDVPAAVPVTNDGFVLEPINNGFAWTRMYDIRAAAYVDLPGASLQDIWASGVASLDGSTVLLGSSSTTDAGHLYDAGTGVFTPLPVGRDFAVLATDRTGARFVFVSNEVRDRAMNLLGTLPGATQLAATMSADGHHVYGLDMQGLVHAYRLDDSAAGLVATEVGSPIDVSASAGYPVRLTLSEDGGMLFVAGDSGLAVMTAP